ncbi:MAG TPA: hypothetical protein VGQ38_02790 [Gaiellaceae bacterium]|nr:hypothetical protein [Gaiellaceae bacterium]
MKLVGLAALFAVGALLAGTALADTTTTTMETTVEQATTTVEPTTTVVVTTVQQTTTRNVIVPGSLTTTAANESETTTDWWVWVLVGLGIFVLVALIFFAARGHDDSVSPQERRRRLDGAVGSWAAQGWALQSQTGESAVVRRGSELMLISVDKAGHVTTQPLGAQ